MFIKIFTHTFLKKSLYVGLSLVLLLALQACHNENEAANLQVIHLSPDAPAMRVNDDNYIFVTDSDIYNYGDVSGPITSFGRVVGMVDLIAGQHNVTFRGLLPDGSTPVLFSLIGQDFAEQTNTIVVAINNYDSIEPYRFVQERIAIDPDTTRVRIAHLAPGLLDLVDVYVTEPDADLANSSATATLSFKQELSETNLVAGDYQIRITPANSQTVLFDSGTKAFTGGQDATLLLADNTANGTSPFELLYVKSNSRELIRDQNTPSDVRLIHTSPRIGALDIAIVESADAVADEITTPLFSNRAYTNATVYQEFVPGTYNLKAVATATTTPIVVESNPTFAFANSHSIYLTDREVTDTNDVTTIETQTLQLTRDQRRIATEAKLDIVNTALIAGIVDVYVTDPGTDITTIDPVGSFAIGGSSNFISREPGTYELTVTENGDATNVLVPATAVTLVGGGLYTAVIVDDLITDLDPDGLPASLLLLDDF